MLEKIKNIEFLRFIFAIEIVYFHFFIYSKSVFPDFALYKKLFINSTDAFLCVEYFFIIAGFFMYYHLYYKNDSTFEYSINKIIRLWPLLAFSIFVIFLFSLFHFGKFHFYSNILNLLFLYCTGMLNFPVNNGHSWFICILFWVSIMYHYLHKCFDKKIFNLIVFGAVFCSYAILIQDTNGYIGSKAHMVNHLFSYGMLRGFASIGLGYFIGMLWQKISIYVKDFKIKNQFKSVLFFTAISALELYLSGFILYYSIFSKIEYKNNMIFIVAFVFLFLLFLAKKGILSKLLENNISVFLGKFSYSIYIMQAAGFFMTKPYLWGNKDFMYSHPYMNISLTVFVCVLIGILSHYFIEERSVKYLKDKLRNIKSPAHYPPHQSN